MIYFIQIGDDGAVKIGWTVKRIEERIRQLQTFQHQKLNILRVIDGPAWGERWLHRHFASNRLENEWFSFHQEMLSIEVPDTKPEPEPRKRQPYIPREHHLYVRDGRQPLTLRIPHEMSLRLNELAASEHRSLSRQIEYMLTREIRRTGEEPK